MVQSPQDQGGLRQPALVASLPEPVPVSAHAGDGQAGRRAVIDLNDSFLRRLMDFREKSVRVIVALPHEERVMGMILKVEGQHIEVSDGPVRDDRDFTMVPLGQVLWVRPV